MEFRIDGYVWVKLTPYAMELYEARLRETVEEGRKKGFPMQGEVGRDYKMENGWARFQMSSLMHIFGPHCGPGDKFVFEDNVIRFTPP